MIGDYLVVASVFTIAGSFVFIIHHFWLRHAFKDEAPASAPPEEESKCKVSTGKASPKQNHEKHYATL
jgi:hypothetical protein